MIFAIVQRESEDVSRLIEQLDYHGHKCIVVRPGESAEVDAYISLSPDTMPVPAKSLPKEKWSVYRNAFAEGVQRVTGRPFAAPPIKGPEDAMVVAFRTHAKRDGKLLKNEELLAWIRDKAEAWARGEEHPERFPYHRFIEWLNAAPKETKPAPKVVDFAADTSVKVPVRRSNARF